MSCSICKTIPERIDVETMHTSERLPKAVEKLETVGGICADYALGEVRTCPECGGAFLYYRDHDSESGTGIGYTDESIERVSPERAKEAIERNIKVFEGFLASSRAELEDPRLAILRDLKQKRISEYEQELMRLRAYLATL